MLAKTHSALTLQSALSANAGESESVERGEHDGGCKADGRYRQFVCDPAPDEHGGNIGQHHAERRAENDRVKGFEPCSEADRGDLRLIADLREKKGKRASS